MKDIIQFKSPNKELKKINKKKLVFLILIIVIIVALIIMAIVYSSNKSFRNFLDKYLFRKIVSEEKLVSIQLDYDSNVSVIGYRKYICVLAENTLRQYNSSGDLENDIKLEISNPVYNVNNKYLVISEKNSSKVYLISDTKILWERELDGNVAKLDVNRNGYVSVIITGTTHKSVIVTYDSKGNELFKTYLSSTTALDATISPDNSYLAFAEINTSGTLIQSNIKLVSIEKAKEEPSESIVYTYEAASNSLITNIEYQDKNQLICLYDDSIQVIRDNQNLELIKLIEDDKKINSADIRLTGYIYRAVEKPTGLFQADTIVELINIDNKKKNNYTAEGVAKKIYCKDNIVAINLGQEIKFINTSGWLVKDYTSSQDIQDVTIANGIAGIIFRDKVEIINL